MKNRLLRRMTAPRNLAATAVLTIAVGGVAYAAIGSSQIMNNSITTADIKNNSLTSLDIKNEALTGADVKNATLRGRDLANNSVTGNQIDESTLAKVPSAGAADTASNADKLGGLGADAFVQTKDLVHVLRTMTANQADLTLVSNGTVSIKMSCTNAAGNDTMRVYASTTVDGAMLESDEDSVANLLVATPLASSEIVDSITAAENTTGGDSGYDDTGWVIDSTGASLITLIEGSSTQILNKAGKDCIYGGAFLVNNVA